MGRSVIFLLGQKIQSAGHRRVVSTRTLLGKSKGDIVVDLRLIILGLIPGRNNVSD